MTTTRATDAEARAVAGRLAPLIRREIASIAALDAAIARESAPDYVVLLHDTKMAKQANVEQMATVIRAGNGVPEEGGGLLKPLLKTQTAVLERVSRRATFRAMRFAEVQLVTQYIAALEAADDHLERRALRKALGRAVVHVHLLTAHIAQDGGGQGADSRLLPRPLSDYFVGSRPRACMRCHLDRPSSVPALERRDPHPFTYVCSGCHAEVLREFPADLAGQMDRWPREVRESRVIQRALGRASKLNAIHLVLYPMAGLEPDLPSRAAERAVDMPAMSAVPGPASGEVPGEVSVPVSDDREGRYIAELFGYRSPRQHW